MFRLHVGKYYVCRNGSIVGPMIENDHDVYVYRADDLLIRTYTAGGRFDVDVDEHRLDIIEEYVMDKCEKKTGCRSVVERLFDEARDITRKGKLDVARKRLEDKLNQLDKAKQAVGEIERQLEDLKCELREILE